MTCALKTQRRSRAICKDKVPEAALARSLSFETICGPQTAAVGHCWVGPVALLQGPAVFPTSHHLTPQLLVLYMSFFSEHPAKFGAENEDSFSSKQGRSPSTAAPGSQQLCTLPAHGLLARGAPSPEPAPSLHGVPPLLQDRGRDLHWLTPKKSILHQDRRSGDQRGRTKGRIKHLESPWQLLGVLRRRKGFCECGCETETLECYDNMKICMNLNKMQIFLLSKKPQTPSDIPDCVMEAERSRAGTWGIQ